MDLALTPDLEELIDEQLNRGRLRTPAEVVREALLLLRERTASKDAEHLVGHIKSLLDAQELLAAQQAASKGAEDHPDHPWLRLANRVLNPRRVTTAPASGSDRTREFDWLRSHGEAYRGQWVALLRDELIAADRNFDAVLREVRARTLDGTPLVHRVD
jgi:Arc/MetJ-type ribon-helix-helix transcriptional regulator